MLMEEAERIAIEEHKTSKIVVIAGVGTRHYYRKLGYHLEGPYMVKWLKKYDCDSDSDIEWFKIIIKILYIIFLSVNIYLKRNYVN